jgi:hypothetical protein
MSDFTTTLHGIKCICRVKHYRPYVPARISGPPEDCYPEESAEFEYEILNLDGTSADVDVDSSDEDRLQDEYEAHVTAIKNGLDFD